MNKRSERSQNGGYENKRSQLGRQSRDDVEWEKIISVKTEWGYEKRVKKDRKILISLSIRNEILVWEMGNITNIAG